MAVTSRLTISKTTVLLVSFLVLGGLAVVTYVERQVTTVFASPQQNISLSADGLGVFIWQVQGGFLTSIADRAATFALNPSTDAEIVSLNGRQVRAVSATARTDRSGRVVVLVKLRREGPIELKGTDLRSKKSAVAVRWSSAS